MSLDTTLTLAWIFHEATFCYIKLFKLICIMHLLFGKLKILEPALVYSMILHVTFIIATDEHCERQSKMIYGCKSSSFQEDMYITLCMCFKCLYVCLLLIVSVHICLNKEGM